MFVLINREVIAAKKHALVEFPLALSAEIGRELQTQARDRGVLCYEEDISLLTESHLKLKQLVKDKQLTEGMLALEGNLQFTFMFKLYSQDTS